MPTRIAFSTTWPERMGDLAGKPTRFPEKIMKGINPTEWDSGYWRFWAFDYGIRVGDPIHQYGLKSVPELNSTMLDFGGKTTTIRSSYKYWKAKEGQMTQPFFWAGKPYRSKQVVFCPPVLLREVKPIWIRYHSKRCTPNITVGSTIIILSKYVKTHECEKFLQSEGFDHPDHFVRWFNKDFDGALLSFGEYINK